MNCLSDSNKNKENNVNEKYIKLIYISFERFLNLFAKLLSLSCKDELSKYNKIAIISSLKLL
jgi:hypothetical protein